jgi:hypothetical protein
LAKNSSDYNAGDVAGVADKFTIKTRSETAIPCVRMVVLPMSIRGTKRA